MLNLVKIGPACELYLEFSMYLTAFFCRVQLFFISALLDLNWSSTFLMLLEFLEMIMGALIKPPVKNYSVLKKRKASIPSNSVWFSVPFLEILLGSVQYFLEFHSDLQMAR